MVQPFTAASHHDVLILLVQIAVLLFTARAFGEIVQRFGQPTVVGELAAGIILGPSLLSGLVPFVGEWLIPQTATQGYLLEVVSMLGAMFLLLITGLETDLTLIRRHARTAVGVSLGGITFTFATGFLLGQYLPDDLLVDPQQRLVFALFVATSMSISAIPVIAKVLIDLNLIRRDIGQTMIAAGMSDDTIGWILLSIVAGLASGEAVTVGTLLQSVGSVLAFMVLSFTLGRILVRALLRFVQDEVKSRDRILSLIVILMFVWGAITQFLNLEAVLGAFVMGILFSQMRNLPQAVIRQLESIALGIFAPIFFAVAGLKVNIGSLITPRLFLIAVLVIAVATIGKVIGTYAGARLIGQRDHWTALSFGAGLNARGAMEIIIATVGLSLGILTQDMFSIIVLMAMTTSLMAPTALRWVLKRVIPGEEELQRLRQEELNAESLVPNIHRVLLPVRVREKSGSSQLVEGIVLKKLLDSADLSLTLLSVVEPSQQDAAKGFLNTLEAMFTIPTIAKKVVLKNNTREQILAEAKKDYDLMLLGAAEGKQSSETLFTPLVDGLIRFAPCPTMLVKGQRLQEDWMPQRILVPSNGSLASRRAAELAFALASNGDERVHILQVVEDQSSSYHPDASGTLLERQKVNADASVKTLGELGRMQAVATQTEVRVGTIPELIILEAAREYDIDLIILGTHVGFGTDHLHLGPRVERILKDAPCPVIVFNS